MFRCMHHLDGSWLGFIRCCVGIFFVFHAANPNTRCTAYPSGAADNMAALGNEVVGPVSIRWSSLNYKSITAARRVPNRQGRS
jgi:hypothetical protein